MKHVLSSWSEALRFLFKDPVNLMLFLIPASLALLLYAMLGGWVLTNGMGWAEGLIAKYVISQSAGAILYYIITGLLIFLFFLLVNWTFVLCLGILASPFNDMISGRIEKKMRGGVVSEDKSKSLNELLAKLSRTLKNELKKILVILLFTVLATGLNFIPVLYPFALMLLALLMSAQFLDYSWSRHEMGAGACFKDMLKHLPSNLVAGLMFLALIAVPFINALVPALATSYYTVLWNKRQLPPSA